MAGCSLQFKPHQHCPHHLAHGWARPHRPTLVSCCWYTPFYPLTPDDTGFSTLSPLVQQHQPHGSDGGGHASQKQLWKKVSLFDSFDVNSTAPISKTDWWKAAVLPSITSIMFLAAAAAGRWLSGQPLPRSNTVTQIGEIVAIGGHEYPFGVRS